MYDPVSPMLRPAVSNDQPAAPGAKARFAEDRLLDAVIWCEVAPGETVTEADVMERFGLTRAAARAGLTRLGYDGWATPQPRTGWKVLPVSGALISQVLDARRVAEPALAHAEIDSASMSALEQFVAILLPLSSRGEPGAIRARQHYLDRVDSTLLDAINPFTARHLRKLWHHTARILHFLEDPSAGHMARRDDLDPLVTALKSKDAEGILRCRMDLIEHQQDFFMRRLMQDHTPLRMPAHRATDHPTTNNRRNV